MYGAAQNLSYWTQSLGLAATLLGTVLGAGSLIWAYLAAQRAMGAREAAELAALAATRLGRIAQLGDLIADMQELQPMLARADFPAIAGKANLLRGRVVRFKTEAYTELADQATESLDLAREQLQIIAKVAATSKAGDERRLFRRICG